MSGSWKARAAFIIIVLSISVALASTDAVTEAEAIRLFLEESPQARQVPLVVRSVDAALRVEARIDDPEIVYEIEDSAGVRDEFLTLQQQVPITGRRGLLGERAAAGAEASGLAAEQQLQSEVYDLVQAFNESLYRAGIVERIQNGAEALSAVVAILDRREREGEGSGYDVLRAEQELAELRIDLAAAAAAQVAVRARFGSFFGPDSNMGTVRLEGELDPARPIPGVEQAVESALAQRLDLRSLTARRQRLDLERRAARRRRFPEPVLTAGWKRTEAVGLSETGYVAAIAVPLPIFDRGRLETARATADGDHVELEIEILSRRVRAQVQAAVAREQSARQTVRSYGEDFERRAAELHRIVRMKYDEGEGDILELLDAHRTALSMELRALAARYEAKSAEIDTDRVIGNRVIGNEVNP